MEKIDFKTALSDLYAPSARKGIHLVDVPPMGFLMVDGEGDPNTAPSYGAAVEALYGVAYTLKFASKRQLQRDYVVPPLEGLWWADDMDTFLSRKKDAWKWTMMIMVPDWIERDMIERGIAEARSKKPGPALERVRCETYAEGLCAQVLHLGSYDDEGPILKRLHEEFLPANGLAESGHHHEIYLSDPRRVAPEKLKTILRQPVKKRPKR